MYLVIRALHVLCGALWLGFVFLLSWFLMPALEDVGPDAGKVMGAMQRRGLVVAIPVIAVVTVLSGIWLYWRYTAGFSGETMASHAGWIFGVGGVLGLVSLILGATVTSRNAAGATRLAQQAGAVNDAAERVRLLTAAAAMRKRAGTSGRLVSVVLIVTTVLMALALYV